MEAATEALARRRARRSLLAAICYINPAYKPLWYHEHLCSLVDDMVDGDLRRLIVCLPPQHGKSEIFSRHMPAYVLGRDPNARIAACSYGADLASEMNRSVQGIMDSEEYKRLFPDTRLNDSNVVTMAGKSRRNNEVFDIVGHRGYYVSTGVGGSLTGKSATWGIIDDPFRNRQDADSPTIRQRVASWYQSVFTSRFRTNSRKILINTRWHRDDLTGWLTELAKADPRAEQWKVVSIPAIAENPELPDTREPGEALWPDEVPIDELRRRQVANPYEFSALYQQNPTAEGGTEWGDGYFPADEIWFHDWPKNTIIKVVTLDPSKGKSDKHGDYSGIVRLAVDSKLDFYIDADLQRRPVDRIVTDFIDHLIEFRPTAYGIETNQFQEVLATEIEKQTRDRGVLLPLVMMENMTSKVARIRSGVGPWLARRRLFFKRHSPGARLLVDQLKAFPNDAHDDGPDALEMAIRMACEMLAGELDGEQVAGTM